MSSQDAPQTSRLLRPSRFGFSLCGLLLFIAAVWMLRQVPLNRAAAQAPVAQKRVPAQPVAQTTRQPAAPGANNGTQNPAPIVRGTGSNNSLAGKEVLPKKENKIVAVVNGEQITRDELGRECIKRYGEEVLESMMNRLLIQDACLQAKVEITEQDVNDEIGRIAKKFKLPVDRWLTLLKEERGVSEDQYRREIIWPTLALRTLAADKLVVSDIDLRKAFESERGPSVRVRIIGTSRENAAREALAKAKANPESFAELAMKYCEDPNIASAGGSIPPIRKHVGDPLIEKTAFALKPGQVSEVLKVQNQYFVIKCEGHDPEQYVSPEQSKLLEEDLRERIRDQKLRTASQEMFQKLQKQSQVVNVYNDPQLHAKSPDIAATLNGRPITMTQLGDEAIARHGRDVLEGEINRKLLTQALTRQSVNVTQQDLDAEVDLAAITYNCMTPDGRPDREKWLKQVQEQDGATIELYIRDAVWPSVALKKLVQNRVQVNDEDLQKGFESNYGPRVEVLAIVLTNLRQAQQVWEMARNTPTDRGFGELAAQYSVEPVSRSNNGKVPPVRKHGGQPIVETEAFKLKPGDLSTILTVADKYVILRCVGRTKPVVSNIGEVRGELEKDIREKKQTAEMTQTFERIHDTAQIDNFLAGTSQSGRKPSSEATTGAEPAKSQPRMGSLPTAPRK